MKFSDATESKAHQSSRDLGHMSNVLVIFHYKLMNEEEKDMHEYVIFM